VFTAEQTFGHDGGTRLTFTMVHQSLPQASIGRFRISVTARPKPVPVPRRAVIVPPVPKHFRVVFDDQPEFARQLREGSAEVKLVEDDRLSGKLSVRVASPGRGNSELLQPGAKISRNPAPGEFRYLRFAWKKADGSGVRIRVANQGVFGRDQSRWPSGAYYAGTTPQEAGTAVVVANKLPEEWTVVTRDLATDFGEFTMTGISLDPMDGSAALFDHIVLARTLYDLEPNEDRAAEHQVGSGR